MSVGVQKPAATCGDDSVRLVLLHDSQGKMLALLPQAALLNLAAVWKQTGRSLQPVRTDDARRFFGQEGLRQQTGQRKLLSLPMLIDPRCADIGDIAVFEPFSALNFRAHSNWCRSAERCELGLSTDQIRAGQPQGSDEELICHAVEKFTALRVKQRLEDTLNLPSLPTTLQKIVVLRSDPDAEVDDLLAVVRLDPSLAAQVMSWAASPYYAAPGEIDSIDDAVMRVLGFELVVNMTLGTALGQMLDVPDEGPRGGTPYWLQAVYTATLTEKLCRMMPPSKRPRPGLAYLSGLLHNFGYLVLAYLFPPQFALLSRYIEANPHINSWVVEQQILNVTREQIGGWLLSNWSLPDDVCDAIRYQHCINPEGEYSPYERLLYLASRLLRDKGLSDGPLEPLADELFEELGLDAKRVYKMLDGLLSEDEAIRDLTETLANSRLDS
ncbi:HDOD domain-containing protein [Marinobacterium jannaschii]|uniref:HDOD domain-containing protein n=1 Tax=Marinobacterium jannaschii TaxID=64970 RepID=UPI000564C635|nr:HDOD domain-containing protein [Marinobacterium jannaschii]